MSGRTALRSCYEPCSDVIGGRAHVDAAFDGCVCGGAELEGERCWSVWYAISVELRDGGWGIRETTIHGKVFVVGNDDWYVSALDNQSTKDLCDEV
jgi:hypothetical protein